MNSTSRLPSVLFVGTWIVIVALPLTFIWIAATGALSLEAVAERFPGVIIGDGLSESAILVAFGIGMIPFLIVLGVMWHMQALFRLYQKGQALTEKAAVRIGYIGVGLLLTAVARILANTLQVLVLSSANPVGHRIVSVDLEFSEIALFLAGGLMIVIGRSMAEAVFAAEEVRGFV
jgi:hypothetical protein